MAVTGTLPGAGRLSFGLGAGAAACTGTVRIRTVLGAPVVGAAVWGVGAAVVAVGAVGGGWAATTFSPACNTWASGSVVGMRARATATTAAARPRRARRRA